MAQSKRKTALTRTTLAVLVCCIGALLTVRHTQAQDASPPTAPAASAPTAPAASAPTAPAAAPAAAPSVWSVGGIDFSGLVDGYYNFNANHPPDSSNGNQLRNFDYDANTFSLNMAKLTASHDPDPVGFRVDLGFGKAFNQILLTEPNFKYLEQAYVSW